MRRAIVMPIVRLLRRIDPTLIPGEGECLAVTVSHEACPLWQLAQEKKAVAKAQRSGASL